MRILALLCLLLPVVAFSQPTDSVIARHNHLTFESGYARLANFDNVGSPLAYAASTAPLGGAFEYVTDSTRFTLNGSFVLSLFNASTMSDPYSSTTNFRKAYFIYANLDVRYVHALGPLFSTPVQVWVGGAFSNMAFGRRYSYDGENSSALEGSGSGEGSSSLDATADFLYSPVPQHHLRASVTLPIVAYIARPAFGLWDGNASLFGFPFDGRVQVIGSFWSWRIALEYEYELSEYFLSGIRLSDFYYHYPRFDWSSSTAESEVSAYFSWRFHF